ncbi:MAG: GNAT family N-acetyltransferase [Saccharofermentanales bacterium]
MSMIYNIRNVKDSDAMQIALIYMHYVKNTTVTFDLASPTVSEIAAKIKEVSMRYPWIVLEIDGKIVGYAYASAFREREAYKYTAEVSVYLSKENIRQGLGRLLANELIEKLKLCGFYTAIAGITATNKNSIRFFESLGFKICGNFLNVGYKNGEWLSVVMLSKQLQPEFDPYPAEISCL